MEGVDGAFQALQQVDGHEAADSFFAPELREAFVLFLIQLRVFLALRGMDVVRGNVNGEVEQFEALVNLFVSDAGHIGEARAAADGFEADGEPADGGGVVIFLDMLARAGDSDAVEQLEEVEIEAVEQALRAALFGGELSPFVISSLRGVEDLVDRFACIEFCVDLVGIAFVGEGELVAQVGETVVDGGGGEHQHFGAYAGADDAIHQAQVTILFFFGRGAAVTEVVALVDDKQIIVAPVEAFQIDAVAAAAVARQVGVVKHVVAQAVGGDRVVFVVALVSLPVDGKFFGAEDEHAFVAVFVVLDHGQSGKRLAQSDAVGEDAAVVFFQFADDAERGVFLEVVEQVPYLALFETGSFVRQAVDVGDVVEKFAEQVVESVKIDEFGRVFAVGGGHGVDNDAGDVLEPGGVVP